MLVIQALYLSRQVLYVQTMRAVRYHLRLWRVMLAW